MTKSSFEPLSAIINAMADTTIVVIGDVMLDRFIYGSADRISPESPVPVLLKTNEKLMCGGAGNAAANLKALGVTTKIVTIIGDDAYGDALCDLLGADIAGDGIVKDPARPTALKTRYIAGHQQLLRVDEEITGSYDPAITAALISRAQRLIAQADAVILSDYGKGVLSDHVIRAAIESAQRAGIPVLVDPKGTDYARYHGADFITPNKKELSEATNNKDVQDDDGIIAASRQLQKTCGLKNIVATRSEKGMSITMENGQILHFAATAREVFDVSGAGDTVIATLAAAIAAKADIKSAMILANAAGGVAVSYAGTAAVSAHALRDAIRSTATTGHSEQDFTAPLCDWHDAAAQIRTWQAQGLRVGFTNGCFDIIHFGHVTYLAQARARCDKLVLGLNHDKSVKILKGPERPIHDENARAAVIGALASVDMVVLFGAEQEGEDNTPAAVLDVIRPDIIFKGGDYTIDQLPEAKIVMAYGGIVDIMPLYEGHSTTGTLDKLKTGQA